MNLIGKLFFLSGGIFLFWVGLKWWHKVFIYTYLGGSPSGAIETLLTLLAEQLVLQSFCHFVLTRICQPKGAAWNASLLGCLHRNTSLLVCLQKSGMLLLTGRTLCILFKIFLVWERSGLCERRYHTISSQQREDTYRRIIPVGLPYDAHPEHKVWTGGKLDD
jgi:hypothetical protein